MIKLFVYGTKNQLDKKNKILNLSDEYIDGDIYNISSDIVKYKEKYKKEYVSSFDKVIHDDRESLCFAVSGLTWRSYFSNDPFLDIIYYFIFTDFLKKYGNFQVYVKSNPLVEYIKKSHSDQICIIGRDSYSNRIKNHLRPYFYVYKIFKSKIRYGLVKQMKNEEVDVLLYSYPQNRCIANHNKWNDHFLGNMYEEICNSGYSAKIFAPLEPLSGYEVALRERQDYILYLAAFFNFTDVIKLLSTRCYLEKTMGSINEVMIGGVDFSYLYSSYLYFYQKSNIFSVRYSLYLSYINMLNCVKPKIVIYPYENQPWEKIINKASNMQSIKTVAINHTMISSDMFYLYNSKTVREESLPSYLLANGKVEMNVLVDMNKHNFTSIELIGSKRHFYQKMELHERKYINRKKVAVVFSGDMSEYYDVIDVLNATKKLSEYTFLLKPPPGEYFNQFLSVYSELADYISFKHFVFDEGLDIGMKMATLVSYGEPFLDKGFIDKVVYAKTKSPETELYVITNGSLVNKYISDLLIEYQFDKIRFSWYGVSEESYSKIHGVSKNYKRIVTDNIKY